MSQPHTWIDVSDLLAWVGAPTGIPRVTYHLVSRYAAGPDVSFFTFSDASRSFALVNRDRVIKDGTNRWEAALPRPGGASSAMARRVARRAANELRRRLPHSLNRRLRALKQPTLTALAAADSSVDQLGRRISAMRGAFARPSKDRGVTFGPGDRVLVLGAGWRSYWLQAALADQRRANGIRVYQLVYDLTPILLPHSFGPGFPDAYARYMFEAAAGSDGLLAISEHSRQDTIRFCEGLLIPVPTIEVFRLGDEKLAAEAAKVPVESLTGSEFILSVGTFELRKNYLLLYQVWKLAREQGITLPRLVIVGRPGWAAGDTLSAMKHDPQVNELIEVRHQVTDAELEWLYSNCLFTVYPSLYEGWGLPVAESLARGKACLASSSSAIPEVAGDLIDYFSPFSSSECLSLVHRYLDPNVRAQKEEQVRARYKRTSWDDSFLSFEAALSRVHARSAG